MLKLLKVTIKLSLWFCLLVALSITLLIATGFTNRPLENPPSLLDASSAKAGQSAVKRAFRSIQTARKDTVILITEKEIDGLMSLLNRGHSKVLVDSDIANNRLLVGVRLQLPNNPLAQYWGFDLHLPATNESVQISQIEWGNFSFSGEWLIPTLAWSADKLLKSQGDITALVNNLSRLQFQKDIAFLTIKKTNNQSLRLRRLSESVKAYSAENDLFTNTELTQFYFQQLQSIEKQYPRGTKVSLEEVIQKLFATVWVKSSDDNAIEHNRSALVALGVYLGTYHFEKIVGRIAPYGYKEQRIPIDVRLANRRDLRLHFIYSSTLQLLSDQGAAFSIGEFKELLDSNTGGSGFSFVDLAADRAGILFAQQATASNTEAREFQERLVTTIEQGLLPELHTLEEGLKQSEFEKSFVSIESKQYTREVAKIDRLLRQQNIFRP